MRIQRLLSLIEMLRARRVAVTADTLSRLCDVSVRTIYRDIEALQSMGVPVRGEAGIGYRLEPGYFLPAIHFDPDEIDAIVFGMAVAAARGDRGMAEAARRAQAKIRSTAPAARDADYDRTPLVASAPAGPEETAARGRLETLRRAIRQRELIDLRYRRLDGALTRRRCRPLGLAAFETVWLLAAWCETRGDFRHFRLDRIEHVALAGARFRNERGKSFADCRARDRQRPAPQPAGQSDAA